MPNYACEEVCILEKIQLLVDFLPLAVYKTIAFHFFHKIILGELFSCTITSLRTLLQTVAYIIHAEPCM